MHLIILNNLPYYLNDEELRQLQRFEERIKQGIIPDKQYGKYNLTYNEAVEGKEKFLTTIYEQGNPAPMNIVGNYENANESGLWFKAYSGII